MAPPTVHAAALGGGSPRLPTDLAPGAGKWCFSPDTGAARRTRTPCDLPLFSEARDEVYSRQLFSLQNLSLIPPEGRGFSSGHPGKPG